MASYEELVKEYKKLAKRADQRMVRLEEKAKTKPAVKDWAYRKAVYEIEKFRKKREKPRWNVGVPKTEKQLEQKIAAIKTFLESPTSTVSGINKIEKERIKSLNERAGTNLSMSAWLKLLESGKFEELINTYGSSSVLEVIGTLKRDNKKIEKLASEVEQENISLSEKLKDNTDYDFVLRETIADILEKEGIKLSDLQ